MSIRKKMADSFSWVDPKWVIGTAFSAVALGAVAISNGKTNTDDITALEQTSLGALKERHSLDNRLSVVESQLGNIQSTAEQILEEVKK